jgi:hypothetical protein
LDIEKRKRKHHTLEEKEAAVNLRHTQNLTYDEIEERTGIPATSVRRYASVKSIAKIRSYTVVISSILFVVPLLFLDFVVLYRKVGRPTELSFADERALAAWARWNYACQLPRTSQLVRQQARLIAIERGLTTKEKPCRFTKKWWRGFVKRHDLTMKRGQRTKYEPPSVSTWHRWMKKFNELREQYGIVDIFNADEIGFARFDTKGNSSSSPLFHELRINSHYFLHRMVCVPERS